MYVISESTKVKYYFNSFEKWWHYFLLCFAWFIPHKMYQLAECSETELKKGSKEVKLSYFTAFLILGIIGVMVEISNIFVYIRVNSFVFIIYAIVLYICSVIGVFIFDKTIKSKIAVTIDRDTNVDIKINLFTKEIWDEVKWRVLLYIFFYVFILFVIYKTKVIAGIIVGLTIIMSCIVAPYLSLTISAGLMSGFGPNNDFRRVDKACKSW